MPRRPLFLVLALALSVPALGGTPARRDPPFPRIANCYGALLADKTWEQGGAYWSKLGLILGGGYDVHSDWDHPRWPHALATVERNLDRLRQADPDVLVLPYVYVGAAADDPAVPRSWWALDERGQRRSAGPGMFELDTRNTDVLRWNLDHVARDVLGRACFDGVFYDGWGPDPWLVPATAKLRDGRAIVMVNTASLPDSGFDIVNGALAEDQINRVEDGLLDFDEFLALYLRWCAESRKPATTTIVCHPRGGALDPWAWARMTRAERDSLRERARRGDQQTMRFGLATALMGDGYFAYDAGPVFRGDWWWYPEYDAPLGHPKGPAHRAPGGLWERDFDGGLVLVNGTPYDAVVPLTGRFLDVSTGRVSGELTLPMFDGRILLPTSRPPTRSPGPPARITAAPPARTRRVDLPGGLTAVQTPAGVELRLDASGVPRFIYWRGRPLVAGGFPLVAEPPWQPFQEDGVTADPPVAEGDSVRLVYRGQLVEKEHRIAFVETCTVGPAARFSLRFEYEALTDLDIGLWSHAFTFPVAAYAGGSASAGARTLALPAAPGTATLLPAAPEVTVAAGDRSVRIESTLPLSLSGVRHGDTEEYLLAGYRPRGPVARGTKASVAVEVTVASR